MNYRCWGGGYNNSVTDTCSPYSLCGDGVVSPTEGCDDGNLVDGDGYAIRYDLCRCDHDCTRELNSPSPRYSFSVTAYTIDPTTGTHHTFTASDPTTINSGLTEYWVLQ